MTVVINILQRVLINHFYKVNTGFFLFMFFVLFGIPHAVISFHLSLIDGIIQSKIFLLMVFVLWLLYSLKCINYSIKHLRDQEQDFLFTLNNLTAKKGWLYMVYVHTMVYLPVIVYAIAIVVIALKKHYYFSAISVILFNVTVVCLSAFVYLYTLQKKSAIAFSRLPSIGLNLPKLSFLIPLFFLWHQRKQMLFVTKVFSLLFLYAFIKLYQPDHYDIRPLLLCCMVCAAAHSTVMFQVRDFEEQFLSFNRNLPVSSLKRFCHLLIMNTLLLMPELIFIWKGYPFHFSVPDYFQLLLMMLAMLSILYSILLTGNINMDSYIRIVFGILAALFFVVLYNPGFLLPCLLLVISFGFYLSYYDDYEKQY